MKVDAGSIFTMAAMSLLTGNVVCTEPTEMEEITKRAKEMIRIFKSKGLPYGDGEIFIVDNEDMIDQMDF